MTLYNVTTKAKSKTGTCSLTCDFCTALPLLLAHGGVVLAHAEVKERYREFLGKNDGSIYEVFDGVDDMVRIARMLLSAKRGCCCSPRCWLSHDVADAAAGRGAVSQTRGAHAVQDLHRRLGSGAFSVQALCCFISFA